MVQESRVTCNLATPTLPSKNVRVTAHEHLLLQMNTPPVYVPQVHQHPELRCITLPTSGSVALPIAVR